MGQRIFAPSKEDIALLPSFPRLELKDISVVSTPEQASLAYEALKHATALGFDTESKPTFVKDEISSGPHVMQFAIKDRAYVFQLIDPTCREVVSQLLTSNTTLKAGFGLAGDNTQIRRTLNIEPELVLDINTIFKAQGYARELGVKSAIAVVFNQRFIKSRKATTSNWANRHLTDSQIIYAANDAWAALKVYEALGLG